MTARSLKLALGAAGIAAVAALFSSVYILPQASQGLVVRFGKPVGLQTHPGLKFKWPLIDNVNIYNTRILTLLPATEQIILGDQKRISVDTYTEYRISDPLRYAQSVQSFDQAQAQLTLMVGSAMRRVLGQVALADLLSSARDKMTDAMLAEARANALPLGIDIVDVQMKKVDLPDETSQAIYDRMTSERQRDAKELRAQGYEWAQTIDAQADQDRSQILAEAQEKANVARGEGDAAASQIFADAVGQDPQFYKFYRALQTYSGALAGSAPLVVLTPDTDVMRYFKTAGPMPSATEPPGER